MSLSEKIYTNYTAKQRESQSTILNPDLNSNEKELNLEDNKAENFIEGDHKAEEIWNKFLEQLSLVLPQNVIKTWFSVISPKAFSNNILTIEVPSEDFYKMIQAKYSRQFSKILEDNLVIPDLKINYVISQLDLFISDSNQNKNITEDKSDISYNTIKSSPNKTISVREEFNTNLNPRHTFENLVKGDNNELAVAVAYAVSNNPGKTYNPFFVYGGVGLGKTHLLQAIGHEILRKFPNKKVFYTTTPEFTTQFTNSIANNRIDVSNQITGTKKLDSFYKSLDVLLLDDVQNLSGKERTQDFIYQIFNTLFNEKKHIIFSSDKPINQIVGIEERLISRFQWGITVDIQPPSWETRVAIIKKKFDEANILVSEEIIHHMATNITDNIRAIEGCIIGIITESTLLGNGRIDFEVADKVLKRVIGSTRRSKSVSIETIINIVAEYYNISENHILSRKRSKEIAFARQVAMFLAKELTNFTLESIGLNFGGKDHATVLYAYKCISELTQNNKEIFNQVNEIKDRIKNL